MEERFDGRLSTTLSMDIHAIVLQNTRASLGLTELRLIGVRKNTRSYDLAECSGGILKADSGRVPRGLLFCY